MDACMLAKEAAARRVDAVVVGGVFFKVWADPFRIGVAHGVDLVEDVLPVLARVAGAGIDPGDADDRDVEWLLAHGIKNLRPCTKSVPRIEVCESNFMRFRLAGSCWSPPVRRGDSARRSSCLRNDAFRSEEHTSELQSLLRISYAVFCL